MKKNLSTNKHTIFIVRKEKCSKDSNTVIIRQVSKAKSLAIPQEKRVALCYKGPEKKDNFGTTMEKKVTTIKLQGRKKKSKKRKKKKKNG